MLENYPMLQLGHLSDTARNLAISQVIAKYHSKNEFRCFIISESSLIQNLLTLALLMCWICRNNYAGFRVEFPWSSAHCTNNSLLSLAQHCWVKLYLPSTFPLPSLHLPSTSPSTFPLPPLYHPSTSPLPPFYLPSTFPLPSLYLPSTFPLPPLYHASTSSLPSLYLPSTFPLPPLYPPLYLPSTLPLPALL